MPRTPQQILLQLLLIFVAAKVAGELFERLRLPSVVGEILAGITLGPYALGWIQLSDTIDTIAELGVIFVLFHAGLETSPQDLIHVGRKALQVTTLGMVPPFLLGFAYIKASGGTTQEAIFVAAAMVATSVGIAARVLGDLNLLSTRTAKIILGAAVFDDILGMVVLAVVAGVASDGKFHWLHLGVLTVEAVAFAWFMILVAPHVVRRMQPRMDQLSQQNASLIVALAICLFLSWLSVKIGMAAIVGAFFAGLMLADYAPQWNLLPRVGGTTEFLAPYFFFAVGARLNVKLFSGKVLTAAIIISLLAIISKLVGCGLPLWREGWRMALGVGVGMVPRGEVALIVALVGLQSRILGSASYAVVVFMTGVTTLIAPPLLRVLFDDQLRGRGGGRATIPMPL
jgi:Kef-type K+ transport system membrane component KefB